MFLCSVDPLTGRPTTEAAGPDELLGIKIVTERLSIPLLSRQHHLPERYFYRLLSRLSRRGVLQAPPTLLRRDPGVYGRHLDDDWLTATSFCLQLHITNACDLRCRHCFDRSRRAEMAVAQAARALDELQRFCADRWVEGYVDISGGNPFLHHGFLEIYQETVRRGFNVAILGNPVRREQVEALCRIKPPSTYQVSLEGRRLQNDSCRGPGSYDRAMSFLGILREVRVNSCVMLTATDRNLGEILPLASLLAYRTDAFCFARLSRTGEGAALNHPDPGRFRAFLDRYVHHAASNEIVTFKESLIGLTLAEKGRPLSDGCTGFGCGAAFNCLSVLPDGDVYACRKFPSLVGNLYEQPLDDVYSSPAAAQYRRGMRACDGCPIRHACGGCMAAAERPPHDISAARDRFCWRLDAEDIR